MDVGEKSAKRSVSTLNSTEGNLVILWSGLEKAVPADPGPSHLYSVEEEEHWYQLEYGIWNLNQQPHRFSRGDGPNGKHVIFVARSSTSYTTEFKHGLTKMARKAGILLEVLAPDPDSDVVAEVLARKPDLVMVLPENLSTSSQMILALCVAGVPVTACNLLPPAGAIAELLFWTGPDDWGQARALARQFAVQMGYRGSYAIVRHVDGSSSFFSRTWGVITELRKIAPQMECVAMAATGLDHLATYHIVSGWLNQFGNELKGIVCADDREAMLGVRDALDEAGKTGSLVCAAFGSSFNGLRLIKSGVLHTLAFQAASIDASVAMQSVILPIYVVTAQNVDDLLKSDDSITNVNFNRLIVAIEALNLQGVYDFFTACYLDFVGMKLVSLSSFYGFGLQTFGVYLFLLRDLGLSEEEMFGDYESVYKQVLTQKNIGVVMQWFINLGVKVIERLSQKQKRKTLISEVLEAVKSDFRGPLSLKVLADQFHLNPIYLGQIFRVATGIKFNEYVAELRIQEAKRLLATTPSSASAIGRQVGFTDPNYFYKVFHRSVGKSVSDFRR